MVRNIIYIIQKLLFSSKVYYQKTSLPAYYFACRTKEIVQVQSVDDGIRALLEWNMAMWYEAYLDKGFLCGHRIPQGRGYS